MFKYKEIMNIIFYDKLWKKGDIITLL